MPDEEVGCLKLGNADESFYSAWSAITVGVADLDLAKKLWVEEFGMTVVSSLEVADTAAAGMWGIEPDEIRRQALLKTGEETAGMLHLVEFENPDEPVRKNANPYDLTPKNLDIYTDDLVSKLEHMLAKGYEFRTQEAHLINAPDGTSFREVHMFGHDDINVVLLEVVGKPKPFTSKGVAAVGPLVLIVPDVSAESDFFESIFLVDKLNENVFSDPKLIKAIGLPDGTVLNIHIWGRKGFDLGQLELIQYQGIEGDNLYPRAKPKSLGLLHLCYVIPDNSLLIDRLAQQGVDVVRHGVVDSIHGKCDVISFYSPAGLRIEVYELQEYKK